MELGMTRTAQRLNQMRVQQGQFLQDYTEHLRYTMRRSGVSFRQAMTEFTTAVKNAFSGTLSFKDIWAGLSVSIGHAGQALGIFTDRTGGLESKITSVNNRMARLLDSYKENKDFFDKYLKWQGTALQNQIELLKAQGQTYTKLLEDNRRMMVDAARLYNEFVEIAEALSKALYLMGQTGETLPLDTLVKKLHEIYGELNQIEQLGELPPFIPNMQEIAVLAHYMEMLTDFQERMQTRGPATSQYQKAEEDYLDAARAVIALGAGLEGLADVTQLADTSVTGLSQNLEWAKGRLLALSEATQKAIVAHAQMGQQLEDQANIAANIYPKAFSMMNKAILDFETNLKHWLTTVRDNGKISTERLQDMRLAVENLQREIRELIKHGGVQVPGLEQYGENLIRNALVLSERYYLLAQRAIVFQKIQEQLLGPIKKVTQAVADKSRAFLSHIPILNLFIKHTKKAAEESEQAGRKMSQVSQVLRPMTFNISIFGDIMGELQQSFFAVGSAADALGMSFEQLAQEKGNRLILSMKKLQLISAGVIAILGGLAMSFANTAAKVTTLETTMAVVAKNTGYGIDVAKQWVNVLRDSNISIRGATTAMTEFMKAQLPLSWIDPVTNLNHTLKDLADTSKNVAASIGEDSSETFMRMLDFIQTGNSQLLNSIGIMKNASQMYKEYADAIGKNTNQLTIYEQKMALVNGLLREGANLQGVYTEAMKTASKQLGSMKRLIEDVMVTWGKHLEPLFASIIFNINKFLDFLVKVPEETKEFVANLVAKLLGLASAFLAISTGLPKLISLFKTISAVFGFIAKGANPIILALGVIASLFAKVAFAAENQERGVKGMAQTLDTISNKLLGLQQHLKPIADWFYNLRQTIQPQLETIRASFDSLITRVRQWFVSLRQSEAIRQFFDKLKLVANDVLYVIGQVIQAVLDIVDALLRQDWQEAIQQIRDIFSYVAALVVEIMSELVVDLFHWGRLAMASFVQGIRSFSRSAIEGILEYVLRPIVDWLAAHSPPVAGPLRNIDDWGQRLFETYLRGFSEGDLSFLDKALDTIRRALQALTDDAKKNASEISTAMQKIRNALTLAISTARQTGGGLDLSGIMSMLQGALSQLAQDIANWLNALYAALQAEESYRHLQDEIERAQEARRKAIDAAEKRLDQIRKQTESINKEIEAMEKRIEKEVEAALQAAGIVIDERLSRELQRQLADANQEVERARKRLDKIRSEAGKYGINILTWEEINAQAQLEMAELRQQQIEEQIDEQERLAREAERIREEIEAQHQKERELLEARLEQSRQQEEALQEQIEAMREADQAAREAEEERLRAAQEAAEQARHQADLMEAILNQKLAAIEEEQKLAQQDVGEITASIRGAISGIAEELNKISRTDFGTKASELFQKALGNISELFGGSVAEAIGRVTDKIKQWWTEFKTSPLGQTLADVGFLEAVEDTFAGLGEAVGGIGSFINSVLKFFGTLADIIGGPGLTGLSNWEKVLWLINQTLGETLRLLGNIVGVFFRIGALAFELLNSLITGDWSRPLEKLHELLAQMAKLVGQIFSWFGVSGQDLVQNAQWLRDELGKIFGGIGDWFGGIGDWFGNLGQKIGEARDEIARLGDLEKLLKTTLMNAGAGMLARILEGFNRNVDKFKGNVAASIKKLFTPSKSISETFRVSGSSLAAAFSGGISRALLGPNGLISNIAAWLGNIAKSLRSGQTINSWLETAKQFGQKVIDGIYNKLLGPEGLLTGIKQWLISIANNLRTGGPINEWLNTAREFGQKLLQGVKEKLLGPGGLLENIRQWLKDIAAKLRTGGPINEWLNTAKEFGKQWIDGIYNRLFGNDGLLAKIKSWLSDIAGRLRVGQTIQSWLETAKQFGAQLIEGIRAKIFDKDGLLDKIKQWLRGVADSLKIGETITKWYDMAKLFGQKVIDGIKEGIKQLAGGVADVLKNVWNKHIVPTMNKALKTIIDFLNGVIDTLNEAARLLGVGAPFPLPKLPEIKLPELAQGGLVVEQMIAMLHPGELVIPLDRLERLLTGRQALPAFSPTLIFQGGASPQMIMPAIQNVYDWYLEEARRP